MRVSGVSGALQVVRYRFRDELSQLFAFHLEVATSQELVASLEKALGAEATVRLQRDDTVERVVHGIV
ncbi:MAG TPA: contractile injection system protein, VgrG/Pvc8 family, partial [Polyangiaceae bacterium]